MPSPPVALAQWRRILIDPTVETEVLYRGSRRLRLLLGPLLPVERLQTSAEAMSDGSCSVGFPAHNLIYSMDGSGKDLP
jgi:hypothetical protein